MTVAVAVAELPALTAWQHAAERAAALFAPLADDARIGLIAREAPGRMLAWEMRGGVVHTREARFAGFADCGMDILLAADAEALAAIASGIDGDLFAELRAQIRAGALLCYMLSRRCELEVQGFEELLEALGFVFMGACR